ncbi:MAG: hypothetical protein PHI32_06400 [Dysgonamonadaceae bacterium]|nr:hypothetical protein [Dysgonamonadaceae bacterium]MDD4728991.1 hypothetical protein [Dysgonamonadaceae bacterium]
MKNNQFRLRLLPNYFKKIGIGILVLTILFFLLRRFNVISLDKTLVLTISSTGVIISLLLLAMSEERIEDELTNHIRLISFVSAFIMGSIFVIVKPYSAMLFDAEESYKSSASILIFMFVMYFMIFRFQLKKR